MISDERHTTPALTRFTVVGVSREADGTLDNVTLALNAGRPA